MKIATIVVRVLMGLMYVMSAIVVLFKLVPQPEMTGNVKLFMQGMMASGYLLTFIKIIELIGGILLITGRYVALAAVVLFPITINIFLYHLFLAPEGLPIAAALLLGNLFLAYAYREKYRPLFIPK